MSASFAAADCLSWSFDGQSRNVNTNGTGLVAGWFRPTTLTAGAWYWGCGPTTSMRVASTTSEINVHLARTTPRVLLTSGAGITVNTWYFLAVVFQGADPVTERIYLGTEDTAPQALSYTATTVGAGSLGTATTLTLGSSGSAGTHFTGQISQVSIVSGNNANLSAVLADDVLIPRYIGALWAGTFRTQMMMGAVNGGSFTLNGQREAFRWVPLDAACSDGTAPRFSAYSVARDTSAGIAVATYASTNTAGTPAFSELEPAAPRRSDIPLARMVLPPLMRV